MNAQERNNEFDREGQSDSFHLDDDGEIQYSVKCYNYIHLETMPMEVIQEEYPSLQMFDYKEEDLKEIEDAKALIDKL